MKKSASLESPVNNPPAPKFKAPLKPRPKLFYALMGVFALWIAALMTLYFVTVYPNRGAHSTQSAKPDETTTPSKSVSR